MQSIAFMEDIMEKLEGNRKFWIAGLSSAVIFLAESIVFLGLSLGGLL